MASQKQNTYLPILTLGLGFLLCFILAKICFLGYVGTEETWSSFGSILAHGFSLDVATMGYLLIIPWLYGLFGIFFPKYYTLKFLKVYAIAMAYFIALICIIDTGLYPFWKFKLDATIFNYIDSPHEALSSVNLQFIAIAIISWIFLGSLLAVILTKTLFLAKTSFLKWWKQALILLFLGGGLFFCIRGLGGRSTTNVGQVYFSDKALLNHSAVNPIFSLFSSIKETSELHKQALFFDEKTRQKIFQNLHYNTKSIATPELLKTLRPNILIILMESFGGNFVKDLGGDSTISPNFNQLIQEGIFFDKCYANSFRTDRGTVSTLSGWPAFPLASIMKMPQKVNTLPSLAQALKEEGYKSSLLYGGDINFTNAKGYFCATGYEDLYYNKDFSLKEQATHAWGVTDSITFNFLYNWIDKQPLNKSWHFLFQTLASHEPWEVPYSRIKNDKIANAMAYLDHHLGKFVKRLKTSKQWDNLLIICIADHSISYPKGINETDLKHSHIPMLWIGGAIKDPLKISTICNQSDMVATLLGQLKIEHKDFTFSRDILSSTYTYPCAMHTWNNGFTFIDSTGYTVYDITPQKVWFSSPNFSSDREIKGKALLQTELVDLLQR